MISTLRLAGDAPDPGWLSVLHPTPEEITLLTTEHKILPEFISHSLDLRERPRIDERPEGTLVVLRAPAKPVGRERHRAITTPIGFLLLGARLVTISRHPNHVLTAAQQAHAAALQPPRAPWVLLSALSLMAEEYHSHLAHLDEQIYALESRPAGRLRNQEVVDLMRHQKSLAYFAAALRGNELVLQRLQKSQGFQLNPAEHALLEDVLVELRQAIEVCGLSTQIAAHMTDSFASMISNNLNDVMKRLTSVSLLASLPMIVAGFYGMNVALPRGGCVRCLLVVTGRLVRGDVRTRALVLAPRLVLGRLVACPGPRGRPGHLGSSYRGRT